jgi:hypothetical protein
MKRLLTPIAFATGFVLAAGPAAAQTTWELGLDGGLTIGLGDVSSVTMDIPASRFRAGFFTADGVWSMETGVGLGLTKIEDVDAVFTYDLEFGVLYHFEPFVAVAQGNTEVVTRENAAYLRPFIGVNGFTGGDTDDSEVSLGAGLGIKVPWRSSLAWRFEGNAGYGFDNEAFRIGLLAGVSFFTR